MNIHVQYMYSYVDICRYDLNDMSQTVSDVIYCIMFTSVSIVYTKECHLIYEYKGYGPVRSFV